MGPLRCVSLNDKSPLYKSFLRKRPLVGAVVVSVLTLIANLDKSRFKILINNRNKRLKRHGMIRLLKFGWDWVFFDGEIESEMFQ